jgi:hypothetical protein
LDKNDLDLTSKINCNLGVKEAILKSETKKESVLKIIE